MSAHLSLISEVTEIESILQEIPQDAVIERKAFEKRLSAAKAALAALPAESLRAKAKLTFRGRPVIGSHGIAADFGSRAAGAFADAFSAVVAALNESLNYMGPIPDRAKNQLLITGTAVGSFGFEFELPNQNDDLFPKTEEALERMQTLFRMSAAGSDDEVTELVDDVHPRAVKKISEFLSYLAQQQAWCGLEFKDHFFRFDGIEQLEASIERLKEDNIHERDEEYVGEVAGCLPHGRTFEFKLLDQDEILKAKIDRAIEDPDVLNRDWLHKKAKVKVHVIQVGQGRPRYTLPNLASLQAL